MSIWDDDRYVINNPYIRGLTPENLRQLFTQTFGSQYHPLQVLSYALEYSLWGLNARGYHLVNVILHGLNVCFAYILIRRIVGSVPVAAMSALLFAVHPVNVENVVWVSERKTLLAAFFFFAAFISYLRFRRDGSSSAYLLSLLLYALALLSKVAVATLPLQLIVYEIIFCKEPRRWRPAAPFFVLSAIGSALAVWAQMSGKAISGSTLTPGVLLKTVYPTMTTVLGKYIGLLLWPVSLSGFYDTTIYHSFLELPVLLSLTGMVIITAVVLARGGAQERFWFLWFLIFLLPVSNIIPLPVFYADRYLYIAEIGFFALLLSLINATLEKIDAVFKSSISKRRTVLLSIFTAGVFFYGFTAYNRIDVWRNDISFWEDTAKKSPGIYEVQLNLGVSYYNARRLSEAERQFLLAYKIWPNKQLALNLEIVRAEMRQGAGRAINNNTITADDLSR